MTKADESKRKRRRHSKSRNGCLHCKKLRVKCDELRPNCKNCITRKKECIYLLPASTNAPRVNSNKALPISIIHETCSPSPAPSATCNNNLGTLTTTASPLSSFPITSSTSSSRMSQSSSSTTSSQSPQSPYPIASMGTLIPCEFDELNGLERELLHHYGCHLSELIMLTGLPGEGEVWKSHIPSLGLGVSYMRNSLFAASALHLTHVSNGNRDLTPIARQQYIRAMQSFAADSRIGNAEALFSGACFMLISCYAFRELPLVSNGYHDLDLLECTRSPLVVINSFSDALKGTKISESIISCREGASIPIGKLTVIQDLQNIATQLDAQGFFLHRGLSDDRIASFPSPLPSLPNSKNYGPYYKDAIESLFWCLSPCFGTDLASRILAWPMVLSREFIYLARSGYPFARVLVGFYASLLHYCQNFFWIGDRGRLEVNKIWSQVGPVWQSLLSWPQSVTNKDHLTQEELLWFLNQRLPSLNLEEFLCIDMREEKAIPLQKIGCP